MYEVEMHMFQYLRHYSQIRGHIAISLLRLRLLLAVCVCLFIAIHGFQCMIRRMERYSMVWYGTVGIDDLKGGMDDNLQSKWMNTINFCNKYTRNIFITTIIIQHTQIHCVRSTFNVFNVQCIVESLFVRLAGQLAII